MEYGNGWLKELLKTIQKDINEIKKDIKGLQRSKWMFDGAKEAVRIGITVGITVLTMWWNHR